MTDIISSPWEKKTYILDEEQQTVKAGTLRPKRLKHLGSGSDVALRSILSFPVFMFWITSTRLAPPDVKDAVVEFLIV